MPTPTDPAQPTRSSDRAVGDSVVRGLQRYFEARNTPVTLVQTHISWVLLAGAFAYKIKKPVRFGFLDFSTVQARRHFCAEELRLNRRLTPSLYLDVVPVRMGPLGATLEGNDPVADYAVKMQRFGAHALASEQLRLGSLGRSHMTRLALRLAAFHDSAPVAPCDSRFGAPEEVLGDALQAVDTLAPLTEQDCMPLRQWFTARFESLTPRWEQRRAGGRVREGHGDLHLDNVVVLPDDVTAFDCIEFNPSLRWTDVMSDIAYLVMDLHAHGRRDLAFAFLDTYLEATGDHAGLDVLRYYLVYRAVVRALVSALRARADGGDGSVRTAHYVQLARQLADENRARLLITHGLPGSGKTWVSRQLLDSAGAIRMRSDVERKRMAGLAPLARVDGTDALYAPGASERTYERLAELARAALVAGFPIIVDAAFLRRAQRDRLRSLARELRVPFTILACGASPLVLRERVQARQQRADDASDAGVAALEALAHAAEPLADDELDRVIELRTDQPVDAAALAVGWFSET